MLIESTRGQCTVHHACHLRTPGIGRHGSLWPRSRLHRELYEYVLSMSMRIPWMPTSLELKTKVGNVKREAGFNLAPPDALVFLV